MDELKIFADKITKSEFNNKPYRNFPKELNTEAKEKGIVVVYGQSDDLMEFEGALYDEFGCYDGGTFYFDKDGKCTKQTITENKIQAIWCNKNCDWTWSYKTTLPHETFEMMDDDEKYCLGFVFYKKDLK